ncbi:MAG: hypothetical protein NTY05_10925 [Rhodocyclales bacterium]|nr:hypothetical protein [Rhodocyclales bacterium]
MNRVSLKTKCALAICLAGILATGPALADKGGKGHQKDEQRGEQRDDRRDDNRQSRQDDGRRFDGQNRHFNDQHQVMVRDYYGQQFRRGRCPPGLAKKHNGCMPPGQERKWQVGYPLPRDVVYYSVPQPLVVQIGVPPSGYRYVRVASDILLMAIGTGMVVDAIQDLGGR